MTNGKGKKLSPPYVSYRTFRNFLDGLQQGIPTRIDRSYWGDRLSGSTGVQLMAALRFLGLADDDGTPTTKLRQLVAAKGGQRAEILKQITHEAFTPVLQGLVDPELATYAQLEECFHSQYQLTADVARKCIKFFIMVSSDAGVTLAPYAIKRLRRAKTTHDSAGTKRISKKVSEGTKRNSVVLQDINEIPDQMSWGKLVLAKFPAFDPAWSDDIKLKWFEAFDRLLQRHVFDSSG